MSDFEDVIKIAFIMVTLVGFPAVLYVGYRYAMMWLRRYEREGEVLHPIIEPEALARVERLEHEVAELQERLDFAERLLAQPESLHLRGGAVHES